MSALALILAASLALPGPVRSGEDRPLFSFGVTADIQYGDKDTRGSRRYRESLGKFAKCVAAWNSRKLAFVVDLGDIIDGNRSPELTRGDLDEVLRIYRSIRPRAYHVMGNHCLNVPREELLKDFRMRGSYYDFARKRYRFIVLDGTDVSTYGRPAGHPNHELAKRYLEDLADSPVGKPWNGALSPEQLEWLKSRLAKAKRNSERVICFCHMPVLEEAGALTGLLWNHAEVLELIEKSGCVAGWFAGHEHTNGYALKEGIHHVTFSGMVEAGPEENAFAYVDVYRDKMSIMGEGTTTDRILRFTY